MKSSNKVFPQGSHATTDCTAHIAKRRVIRIFISIFLLLVIATLIVYCIRFTHTTYFELYDSNYTIYVNQTNCRLLLSSSQDNSSAYISISSDVPNRKSFTLTHNDSYINITSFNKYNYTDACWVNITYPKNTQLNGLNYICMSSCAIVQQGYADFGKSSVSIRGNQTSIYFQNVSASSFTFYSTKGDVYIENANILNDASISTLGDIVFQSELPYRAEIVSQNNYYCIQSPFQDIHVDSCSLLNSIQCLASISLCSGQPCAYIQTPVIHINGNDGNIHCNHIVKQNTLPKVIMSFANGTNLYNLSESSLSDFDEAFTIYNSTEKADSALILQIGNALNISELVNFLVVPNIAYLCGKPWWLSFFSLSLLVGKTIYLHSTVIPSSCPFQPYMSLSDIYNLQLYLKDLVGDKSEVALLSSQSIENLILDDNSLHAMPVDKIDIYKVIKDNDKGYSIAKYGLKKSKPLEAAIIISVIMCFVVGVLSIYLALIGLKYMTIYFSSESQKIKKYLSEDSFFQEIQSEQHAYKSKIVEEDSLNPLNKKTPNPSKASHVRSMNICHILTNLPNQFEIIDHLSFMIKRNLINSLQEFTSILVTPINENEEAVDCQHSMDQIKELYEKFCFVKSYSEASMLDETWKNAIRRKGFKLCTVSNATTMAYIKIRFIDNPRAALLSKDNDNSLDEFINTQCKITNFEEDYIDCDQLKQVYLKFCLAKDLLPLEITRTKLSTLYKIPYTMKAKVFIERDPYYKQLHSQSKLYKIDIANVKNKLHEESAIYFAHQFRSKSLAYGWYLHDLISVLLHIIIIIILSLLPFAICYFYELMYGKYSITDYEHTICIQDWIYSPWIAFTKLSLLSKLTRGIGFLGIAYFTISFIHLVSYYSTIHFPLNTIKRFSKISDINADKILSSSEYFRSVIKGFELVYFLLTAGLLIAYIFLVLQWNILGAILNPVAYLVYASSATTFLIFVTTKYRSFKAIHATAMQILKQIIWTDIKKEIVSLVSRMLSLNGLQLDDNNKIQPEEERTISSQLKDSVLGKKISEAGYDAQDVVNLFDNSISSYSIFSSKYGIPIELLQCFIYSINSNIEGLKNTITELTTSPPYNFPPHIMKCILGIALEQNDASKEAVIAQISVSFIEMLQKQLHIPEYQYNIKIIAFPQIINSLKCLTNYDMDGFIEQLKSANKNILISINELKESANLLAIEKENIAINVDDYALPDTIFDIIELSRLLAPNSNGITARTVKLRPSLLALFKKACCTDSAIIDILNAVFSSVAQKSTISSISKNFSSITNIPSFYISAFLKMLLKDYSIDNDMVCNIELFIKQNIPSLSYIDSVVVENILRLRTLLEQTAPFPMLKEASNRYHVQPESVRRLIVMEMESKYTSEGLSFLLCDSILNKIEDVCYIDPKELIGFIAIAIGSYKIPEVIDWIKATCDKHSLPIGVHEFIYSLLVLIISNNTSDLIQSLNKLLIKEQSWLLVGKQLLDPSYITSSEFDEICIKSTNAVFHERITVNCEDVHSLGEWVNFLINEINLSSNLGFQSTILDQSIQIKRSVVSKLLTINSCSIDMDFVKCFIHNYYIESKMSVGTHDGWSILNEAQIDTIQYILQIATIVKQKSKSSIIDATRALSKVMKCDERIIALIIGILIEKDSKEIANINAQLLNVLEISKEKDSIAEFGRYVKSEIDVIYDAQLCLKYFADIIHLPAFILRGACIEYDTSVRWSMKECLSLFDSMGIHRQLNTSQEIDEFNEIKISLVSPAIGYPLNISKFEEILKVPGYVQTLIKTLLVDKVSTKYKILNEESTNICQLLQIDSTLWRSLVNLIAFKKLYGNASNSIYHSNNQSISLIEELSAKHKISSDILSIYDCKLSGNFKIMIDCIKQHLESTSFPKHIILGFASLLVGNWHPVENFAEAMGFEDDRALESLLLLNRMSDSSKITEIVDILCTSPCFAYFCTKLSLNPEIVKILILLSFNYYSSNQLVNALKLLKIQDLVNIAFCKTLGYIAMGYNSLVFPEMGVNRMEATKLIKKQCSPLFYSLGVDQDLSLITLRVRQGDFLIINDYQGYVSPLLPTITIRNVTMAICGMLVNPIKFEENPNNLHGKLPVKLTFEGANHLLCNTLHINPLLARLTAFDSQINKLQLSLKHKFITSVIISLGNANIQTSIAIVARSFIRSLQIKKVGYERVKDETENKARAKKLRDYYNINFYDSLAMKTQAKSSDYLNKVDEVYSQLQDHEPIANMPPSDIVLESLWFNNPKYMLYDYELLLQSRKRHFNFSENKIVEIIGTKEEFDNALRTKLLKRNKATNSINEFIKFNADNCWVNKKSREGFRNAWFIFNTCLRFAFLEYPEFDRISVAQMMFYIFLLSMKYKIEGGYDIEGPSYSVLMGELEVMLFALEVTGFINGTLDISYDRMSLVKFISLATGIKLSNKLDYKFLPSLFSPKYYFSLKDEEILKSTENISAALQYLSDIDTKFEEIIGIQSKDFHIFKSGLNNDLHDYEDELYGDCNPYDLESVLTWQHLPLFEYQLLVAKLFDTDENIDYKEAISRKLLVINRRLADLKSYKPYEESEISNNEYQKAYSLMNLFEQYFVVENGFTYIQKLAVGNFECNERNLKSLKAVGIIKTNDSGKVYKDLIKLMCMKRHYYDYKLRMPRLSKCLPFNINGNSDFLGYIPSGLNTDWKIVEKLILIAHGINEADNFTEIGRSLNIDSELLWALFMESLPDNQKLNKLLIICKSVAKHSDSFSISESNLNLLIKLFNEKMNANMKEIVELICNEKWLQDYLCCSPFANSGLFYESIEIAYNSRRKTNATNINYIIKLINCFLDISPNYRILDEIKIIYPSMESDILKLCIYLIKGKIMPQDSILDAQFAHIIYQSIASYTEESESAVVQKITNMINIINNYKIIYNPQRINYESLSAIFPEQTAIVKTLQFLIRKGHLTNQEKEVTQAMTSSLTLLVGLLLLHNKKQTNIGVHQLRNKRAIKTESTPHALTIIDHSALRIPLKNSDNNTTNQNSRLSLISSVTTDNGMISLLNELKCKSNDFQQVTSILVSLLLSDFLSFSASVSNHINTEQFTKIKIFLEGLYTINSTDAGNVEKSVLDNTSKYQIAVKQVTESLLYIIKLQNKSENAMNFLAKYNEFVNNCIILLHSLKLSIHHKKCFTASAHYIISSMLESQVSKYDIVTNLINGILGVNIFNESGANIPFAERLKIVVDSVLSIYFKDFQQAQPLIRKFIFTIISYSRDTRNSVGFQIATDLAHIFNVNSFAINGVIGIINQNMEAVATFISPKIKIDSLTLSQLLDILKSMKKYMLESRQTSIIESEPAKAISETMKEIMKKLKDGNASVRDLFDLVDEEGDKTGRVSKNEFKSLLSKMSIEASDQRVNEIFTQCKKSTSNFNELDADEFQAALDIVQYKDIRIGLELVGLSTSQLIVFGTFLVFVLVMLLIFILLGINAFTPGGIFNSVINSIMPILAGVGVGRSGAAESNELLKKKLEGVIEDIKKIIGRGLAPNINT